jgi:hypothetical protein
MFQQLLNSSDVCSNCFRQRRVDVIGERRQWDDLDAEPIESRPADHTTVDYVPGPVVSDARHRFCSCGAHGGFTRIWEDDEIGPQRFSKLLKASINTALAQDVEITRSEVEELVSTARHHRKNGDSVNDALSAGFSILESPQEPEGLTP